MPVQADQAAVEAYPMPRPAYEPRPQMSGDASMLPGVTTLSESLIKVLGPRTGKPLEAIFGLRTVGDLLRHYPRRYYTRGELTDLSSLREGDHVTVLARVEMLPGAPPNADLTPELAAEFATEMIPVYPASAKFSSWRIAKSVQTVLATLDAGEDPLPAELKE